MIETLNPFDLGDFSDRLLSYFDPTRSDSVERALHRYLQSEPFTGRWFERLADTAHPDAITEKDLVAVTMLGVDVPAPCAIWLLTDGRQSVSRLLERLPTDLDIWEANDEIFEVAEELWELLNIGDWPTPGTRANQMGRTIKSKLLAAKRPRLLPVLDAVVCDALGEREDFWSAFRHALSEPEGRLLESVRSHNRGDVSVLRCIDIVVWMTERHPSSDEAKLS